MPRLKQSPDVIETRPPINETDKQLMVGAITRNMEAFEDAKRILSIS